MNCGRFYCKQHGNRHCLKCHNSARRVTIISAVFAFGFIVFLFCWQPGFERRSAANSTQPEISDPELTKFRQGSRNVVVSVGVLTGGVTAFFVLRSLRKFP